MTTCPQCGTQNLPGMAYCEHCGAPLEQETAPAVQGVDSAASAASAQAQAILDSLHADATAAPPAHASPTADVAAPAPTQIADAAPAATEGVPTAPTAAADPTSVPGAVPVLAITFPDGATYEVATDVTNIGRSDVAQDWHPELDLIPFGGGAPDMGVSRHQAVIQRSGTSFSVIDVGSTNGTFVNGKALSYNKPVELRDGDSIAFGAFNAKITIR